ncbi:MAG: pantoate--beta-alanine ligase [Planctomycetota bacterium]
MPESAMDVVVYLGLGSNMGDRQAHIETALARLDTVPGVSVQQVTDLRETEPCGGPPQGSYLNGAARLACGLSPHALLGVLKQLEQVAGRDLLAPPNSPRPLDLDILLFGDERIDDRDLVVPHPRLWEREFVRTPLTELGVDVDAVERWERPQLVSEPEVFAALNTAWLRGGCTTGLVPTMGALHEGHAALLRQARFECDRVAATIFVNPLQFGPSEDFGNYPRTLHADLLVLRSEGVDAVFVPTGDAVYPEGFASGISVGAEAAAMEGATRAGHFEGVVTVVAKLFALARPTFAYFGRKDAQQLAVIRRMTKDLGFPVGIRECATVRAADGLAVSSRNSYLSPADRAAAPVLHRALAAMRTLHQAGERDMEALLSCGRDVIRTEPEVCLDYLELRREGSLAELSPGPVEQGRILVAALLGKDGPRPTRLIDNMSLAPSDEPPAASVAPAVPD